MRFKRKSPVTEKRITLPEVSWDKLEALLTDLGNQRSTRITYYQGKLEMLEPHAHHDRIARLIDSLLMLLADAAGDDLCSLGSQLLKHQDRGIAIQPDACYYLAQRHPASDRAELDLGQAPQPDLVIDIQFDQASPKRMGLFASLGIPEIWQYVTSMDEAEVLKGRLTLLSLQENRYAAINHSRLYDFLPGTQVDDFIRQSDSVGLAQALTVLRSWTRNHLNA
jgi:Uma2 family endonuclease